MPVPNPNASNMSDRVDRIITIDTELEVKRAAARESAGTDHAGVHGNIPLEAAILVIAEALEGIHLVMLETEARLAGSGGGS